MKSISLLVFWIALASCLFAQTEVITKESVSEKTVSVNVNENDDGQRTVKITTEEGGQEKVIEWTDNGIIPPDVKRQLEKENIDVQFLEKGEGKQIVIEVDEEVEHKGGDHSKMMIIRKDDGGEVEEYEWDGEGEMPSKMKKLMEEHDIDLGELHEEHDADRKDGKKKVKMKVMKDRRQKMRRRAMANGRQQNRNKEEHYKVITIDEDGEEKTIEWDGEGEMPDELKKMKDNNVFILKGDRKKHKMLFIEDEDVTLSDAYMGAQIESSDNGAQIIDVMKDSPADKAGLQKEDIVQRVNGARVRSMEDLLSILNFFDPNDTVELNVTRNGKEKKLKMTLGTRPDSYR